MPNLHCKQGVVGDKESEFQLSHHSDSICKAKEEVKIGIEKEKCVVNLPDFIHSFMRWNFVKTLYFVATDIAIYTQGRWWGLFLFDSLAPPFKSGKEKHNGVIRFSEDHLLFNGILFKIFWYIFFFSIGLSDFHTWFLHFSVKQPL